MDLEFDLIGLGPNINHRLSQEEARHTMTNDGALWCKIQYQFQIFELPGPFHICVFGIEIRICGLRNPAKSTDL